MPLPIIPPLVLWTLGALGAAAFAPLIAKEYRRINAELEHVRAKPVKKNERAKYRTLRRDPRTGVYREEDYASARSALPGAPRPAPARRQSAAAYSRGRPFSGRHPAAATDVLQHLHILLRRPAPLHRRKASAARDRAHRQISPALRHDGRRTDVSRKYRQSLRADCRCTFPSPPTSRPAIRRGLRSCAKPRSWHRDSSSIPPTRHRPETPASARARAEPRSREARQRDQRDRENDRGRASALFVARRRRTARAIRPSGIEEHTEEQFREERTTPAMITAMTIMRTSPLRIWVSSCASTASISSLSSAFIRPVVTVIEYCCSLRPVAKALSASLSITLSFGIGMPREMQRFSSRL